MCLVCSSLQASVCLGREGVKEEERRLRRSRWNREKGEVVQRRLQRELRVSYLQSHTHSGTFLFVN